jgi:N,N'-diacetylchitobiose transport system permease protein
MSAVEETLPATSRRRSRATGPPHPAAGVPAAPAAPGTPRGRRRLVRPWVPYALVSPAMLVLLAIIVFPIAFAIIISFQSYGAPQFVSGVPGVWIGFKNYQSAINEGFVSVLVRTSLFTVTNVGLTIAIGFGLALLMRRAATWARVLLSIALVVVWSIPQITSAEIFGWLFDTQYGVVNWLLTFLHLGNFTNHDWWINPVSMLGIATAVVVWGAVPFVAITLFAGLLQIPDELYEAARVDGAGFIAQMRTITIPLLAPILLLLTTLSILWDSRVFTQIYALQQFGGIPSDTNLFGLWSYSVSFAGQDYGAGAAISLFFTAVLLLITAAAVRMMVRGAQTG